MKKTVILLLSFFILFNGFTTKTSKKFKKLLEQTKMSFELPEGWKETKIFKNEQMNYDFALKHPIKNIEVRYRINVFGKKWPEGSTYDLMPAVAFNISKYQKQENGMETTIKSISILPVHKAKEDFNADWEAKALVETNTIFGQNYKYCLFYSIYKKGLGEAYIFYLSDDKDNLEKGFEENIKPVFKALSYN